VCMVIVGVSADALSAERTETRSHLAEDAIQILRTHCHRCHGIEYKIEGMNVLDLETLTSAEVDASGEEIRPAAIVVGHADQSRLYEVIEEGLMPPLKELNADEQAIIRDWINASVPWPTEPKRDFISETDVLERIAEHLLGVRRDEVKYQRYFTLTHIHNNPKFTQQDLRIHRAALSKAVNSMSDQATIVVPKAIDDAKTVFNIDLRHYGWEAFGIWEQVLAQYPYGLKPQAKLDDLDLYDKIEGLYGAVNFDGVTALRGDWFIANATRPPLYHELAKIPKTLDELLERADVDIEENFRLNTSRRAGLFESGVSGQNRLIEYHSSNNGRLWLSYDFDQNQGRGNLARFPLGPTFADNEFDQFAFDHAGGEIIFNLPNGLHGYMLVDGEGDRIDAGPVNIVWDSKNISGSPLIVNGLSCISCHRHGMIRLKDFVRDAHAVQTPQARRKIRELYPGQAELDRALADTKSDYLQRLWDTTHEALELSSGQEDELINAVEPVSKVTEIYGQNIDLQTAASELGIENADLLQNQVVAGRLSELGLGPLSLPKGTIKRAFWDSKETTATVFQEAAAALDIGTPVSN
ncbi:MAG: transcriptional regulator, partial [Planctomycetota bacterium]